jgi:multimeric flavodoxin WrbA
MKLLCISGSPICEGNTHRFIKKALEVVHETDIELEIIELAKYDISDCIHCDWCLTNSNPERICKIKDEGEALLWKIRETDILVIASPVFFGRLTGRLASLVDRTRPMIFSKPHRGIMRDKVGVALCVAWGRNMGQETTLISIVSAMLIHEMIPVSNYSTGSIFGAAGVTDEVELNANPKNRHVIELDSYGIKGAQALMIRAIDLTKRIKRK